MLTIYRIRTLVYPMYKIDPSPCLSQSRQSAYQMPLINNPHEAVRDIHINGERHGARLPDLPGFSRLSWCGWSAETNPP